MGFSLQFTETQLFGEMFLKYKIEILRHLSSILSYILGSWIPCLHPTYTFSCAEKSFCGESGGRLVQKQQEGSYLVIHCICLKQTQKVKLLYSQRVLKGSTYLEPVPFPISCVLLGSNFILSLVLTLPFLLLTLNPGSSQGRRHPFHSPLCLVLLW